MQNVVVQTGGYSYFVDGVLVCWRLVFNNVRGWHVAGYSKLLGAEGAFNYDIGWHFAGEFR
eukprot:14181355-Alexandrium_andersonii.AAC.1